MRTFSNLMLVILPCLCLSYLLSCSLLTSDPRELKSKNYSVEILEGGGWKTIPPDLSDFAFINEDSGAVFTTNSICKKYQTSSLDILFDNILSGIEELKIIYKKKVSFAKRAALMAHATGMIDGVTTNFYVLTFKRNRCTYDFILISPPQGGGEDLFRQLIGKVRFTS